MQGAATEPLVALHHRYNPHRFRSVQGQDFRMLHLTQGNRIAHRMWGPS